LDKNSTIEENSIVQKERNEAHNIYDKDYRHNIFIKESSKLYKILEQNKPIRVNSIHNVMIKDSDVNHLEIVAHDVNGFVEAVELKDKIFCLGVKWHPEIMEDDKLMQNLMKEFVKSCDSYHRKKNI